MKFGRLFFFIFFSTFFLISGCQGEREEKDYSGVSSLITERNKARYKKKTDELEKKKNGKIITTKTDIDTRTSKKKKAKKKEEISSIVLYEENVKIVSSESDKTLAKGVAYLNKKGQIVKIKVVRNSK